MHSDIIDEALNKLIAMPFSDLKGYKPGTVGDAIAFELLKKALFEHDTKSIAMVTDRVSGRVTTKSKENKGFDNGTLDKIQGVFGGR